MVVNTHTLDNDHTIPFLSFGWFKPLTCTVGKRDDYKKRVGVVVQHVLDVSTPSALSTIQAHEGLTLFPENNAGV